jgi:hypothetical protein
LSSSDTITCPSCGESIPTDYVVCPYDGYSLVKELREKIKVKIKLREGINRAYRLLRDPRSTIQVMEEVASNVDRKGPLFILFAFSFLYCFRLAAYTNAYVNGTSGSADMGFILILGLVAGLLLGLVVFIFTVIFWNLITLIVHFGSRFLSGTATYRESQSVVGYSMSPFILGLIILNVLLFFMLPDGDIISTTTNALGQTVGIGYNEDGSSITSIYMLLFLIFAAWAVAICGFGLELVHRLPRLQAFGLPGAIAVIYFWLAFII